MNRSASCISAEHVLVRRDQCDERLLKPKLNLHHAGAVAFDGREDVVKHVADLNGGNADMLIFDPGVNLGSVEARPLRQQANAAPDHVEQPRGVVRPAGEENFRLAGHRGGECRRRVSGEAFQFVTCRGVEDAHQVVVAAGDDHAAVVAESNGAKRAAERYRS